PTGFLEQKFHFSDSITFKQWKDLLLQYTENPENLTVILYKGDKITYGTLKILLSYPKLYAKAWDWAQQFSLDVCAPLSTDDVKWAAKKAGLKVSLDF
ncbi:MAG: hypothetical protein ACTSQQ_16810, partial [Candidatus Helarchaeota archaeon]